MFVVEMAEEATETGDTVVEEEVKDEKVEEEMEEKKGRKNYSLSSYGCIGIVIHSTIFDDGAWLI